MSPPGPPLSGGGRRHGRHGRERRALREHGLRADGSGGIKVVDVTSPAAPKLAASLAASGYARSVAASGNLLGVGSLYDGGYQLFDISQPARRSRFDQHIHDVQEGWRVVLSEGRGVVVDYFSGLFFLDFADPKKPAATGFFPTPSTVVGVCGRDRYAFAVGELSGCWSSMSVDPARPVLVADEHLPGRPEYRRQREFRLCHRSLVIRVFDVTDPAKPKRGNP